MAAEQKREANMFRRIIISLFLLSFVSALSACGDTWRGAKKDTGENMEKTGQAIERAGENVKP
jgi:predicted small secreted protein